MSIVRLALAVGLLTLSNGLPDTLGPSAATQGRDGQPELDAGFWYAKAVRELERRRSAWAPGSRAKNVILFLGDGMSVATLTAARLLKAERENVSVSQAEPLSFEKFLFAGLSRTYCVDAFVADSACSATAYLGGAKGNRETVGVTARVKKGDAAASLDKNNHVNSMAYIAQKAGKATGFVTNTRVTHASPSGMYAHCADRVWENDQLMEDSRVNSSMYDDIAEQLIYGEPGRNFNVIMGGGRSNFLPKKVKNPKVQRRGARLDNVDLIEKWMDDKRSRKSESFKYVTDRTGLMAIQETPSFLLGLFASDHLSDHYEKKEEQPSLAEMTESAIKVLKKAGGSNGFFLFVEGGRIDLAHHFNQAHVALDETIEFSKAVEKALEMTDESDTLIVVTSDHSHTMSFSGYSSSSDTVVGFAGNGTDNMVYTTLSYANGPSYTERKDLSKENTTIIDYKFPSAVPLSLETHGGDDVAVFARGPNAQLFSGTYDQSYIPHAMAFAANLYGEGYQ